ncbi:unnamed protein product [Schistocephalus solidus]|uniref:E3 ubiquitin-protein ligase n=2 Tax=Schistocephalus solidus TaxID=70667 RepID=A0A183SEQ5_SCHSO|nr:unnamed protein product [Schistocephalus solidus]
MSEFAIPGTPEFTDLTSSTATAKNTKSTCQAVDADIPQHVASDLVSTLFSHISASTASSSQRSHKIMTRAGGSSRAHKDENIVATAAPFSSEMILRGVSKQPTMGSVFSGDPPANGAASASSWFAFRPLCFTPVDGKASGSTPCPTQSSPLNSSLTFGAEGSVNGTGASGAGMSAGGSGNGGSSSILQFVQSNPAASKFPLLSHRSETSSTGYLRQPPLYFASAYVAAGQANGTAAGANTACFQSHASASTGGHEKRPQRLELFSSSSIPQNRHVQQQQSSNQHCATTSSSFIAGAAASTYSSGARGCVIGLGRSSGSGGAPSVFTAPSSNVNQRIMQLQQSFSDRSAQLILLQEINQALLMGSEDALAGIAVRSLVSCILDLLDAETNDGDESLIELKNLSCNVLSHLMDVLPKAADAVVLAIPLLLNTMSCSFVGDILERIINVLEQVSRRHGRQVLLYGGITVSAQLREFPLLKSSSHYLTSVSSFDYSTLKAVLGYYDFVTVAQHRTILSMIANCFSDLRKEDFDMVLNCLPSLCERLQDSEPRCVERVCLCFARLIEAYRNDPEKLKSVVSFGLFENLKRLISASPPVVSNVKDIANMLATICSSCPDLAVKLLQLGTELMPPLPAALAVPSVLSAHNHRHSELTTVRAGQLPEMGVAHWLTDRRTHLRAPQHDLAPIMHTPGLTNSGDMEQPSPFDSQSTVQSLDTHSTYTEPTAWSGISVRLAAFPGTTSKACDNNNNVQCQKDTVHLDVRAKLFETECRRLEKLLQSGRVPASPKLDDTSADIGETDFGMVRAVHLLLPLLFEVYAELNGIAARLKCLEAIHRMVFYATPLLLSKTVCPRSVSGPIAGMLSSRECTIVVAGLLLASVFIDRLPLEFSPYFRKEGVLFHLSRISEVCAREPVTGASAEPYLHPVPIIPMESSAASSSAKSDKRRHYVGPISVDERAVQVHAGRFASARNATSQNQANNSVSDPPASLGPSLISSVDVRVQRSDAAIEMTQSDIVLSSSRQKTDSGGATVCPQTSLADSPGAVTQPGSSALSFSIPSSMDRMLKGRILNRGISRLHARFQTLGFGHLSAQVTGTFALLQLAPSPARVAAAVSRSATETSLIVCPGRDSSLRDWILTHCQFLHSRILSVSAPTATTTNSNNPTTLAAKVGRHSPNQSKHSPYLCFSPLTPPTDLFPELESIRQQLLAPNDCLAWATGLRRLAAILTPSGGGGGGGRGAGMTEQSAQEIPSPFEMQHSGLLHGLMQYLTSSSDRKLRIYLLLMTFVGSRYTEILHLRDLCDNPKTLAALSKLSALCPSEPRVSPFSALVSCLLVYLHQQVGGSPFWKAADWFKSELRVDGCIDAIAEVTIDAVDYLKDLRPEAASHCFIDRLLVRNNPTGLNDFSLEKLKRENFQVLAGPSLSPLMPNAESTLSPHYEEGISRMKSFFAGGGNQNCDFRSIDHEMSGGSASIGGHRNRRTVKSTSTTSASKSTGRPGSNQRYRHPIRRWSSFVPGFLKLDLVYCRSSSSNCLSSSAVDSSSNNKSHSSRSAVSESPESATEALVKGTIWETPPSSIPLHVNALATAQSLKQLLTQRIFLASLVSTCSSGARGSEVTADPSSSIPAAAITPWHPVPFLQKHGTPSRRPLYQQASGNSDQPIDVSDSDCDSHSSTVIGDAEEEEEEEEVTSSIGRLEPSSSFSHAKHHGQVRYVQKHEGSALRKRQITYSLRQSDSEHSHRPPTATVHQDHRAYPVASAEASASVNNRSLRQQNTAPASGQKPCDSGAFVCSNPASATAGDGAGVHSVPEKRHSSALEGKPAKTSAGLRPSSGILRRTGFDASSSSNGSTPDKCVSQASASRPKSMSLLAAFGMLQFASSSSAAASSSSSSPLTSAAASWRYRSLLPASKASASSSRVPTKDDHSSLKLHQVTSHSSKCSGGGGKSQHQSQAQQQHSVAHHHHHYRGRGSGSSTHQHMFAPTDLDGRLTPVFYVNGYRIPSNMPLYQAVRRYSDVIQQKASALQTDAFYAMSEQRKEDEVRSRSINTCMWKYSHTVHYRLEPTSTADSTLQCSPETRTSTSYCPLSCTAPSTAAFSSNRKFGTSKLSPTSLSAAINCLKRPRRIGDPNTGTSTSNTTSPAELVPSPDFPALLPHTGADPASAATLASSPAPISRESLLFSHFSSKLWPCCFSGSAAASLRSSASAMEDECLNTVLVLLRIFNAISELGNTLDDLLQPYPILPPLGSVQRARRLGSISSHPFAATVPQPLVLPFCDFFFQDQFRSHKLSAKASRQLQDVFSVLAGNLPDWLIQLMSMCPFLFPFSIRQTFFYVHNFDRERTILHLQDSTANVGSDSDASLLSPSTSSSPFGNLVAAPSFSGFSSHQLPLSVSPGSALQLLADVDTGGSSGGSASVISLLTSSLLGSTTAASSILLLGSSSSSEAAVDGDSASGVTLDSLLESAAASSSIVGSGGGGSQLQHHKVTVARDPKRLFRQAEATFNELKASRAVLEIAFDGEVGFGLGPTLEFYTLISHYLMSASLNLWHGNEVTSDGHIIPPPSGLYPRPLAKNARSSLVREVNCSLLTSCFEIFNCSDSLHSGGSCLIDCPVQVRSKFFFLGQLMARSLLDWRQLDLPFSLTFFKWFLYVCVPEDLNLAANPAGVTAADIAFVDPDFARHYQTLMRMNRRRQNLLEALSQHQPVTAGRTLRTDDVSHSQLHPSQSRVRKELQALDAEIDDLCLSFVLPGYQVRYFTQWALTPVKPTRFLILSLISLPTQIELCKNGAQTAVTASNLSDYLVQCANWLLVEGVRRQMLAVIEGFDAVLPGVRTQTLARLFRPHECEGLFCGADHGPPGRQTASGWDVESLMKSCLCDHGYTLQSRTIQFLFEILSEFDERQRRLFVQFTTGSPRLPVGGFRSLKPPLKIVMKKEAEDRADNHLPSVMTCQNYLKLPNYSTKEIMREKLIYAINEGQNAFHLS